MDNAVSGGCGPSKGEPKQCDLPVATAGRIAPSLFVYMGQEKRLLFEIGITRNKYVQINILFNQ